MSRYSDELQPLVGKRIFCEAADGDWIVRGELLRVIDTEGGLAPAHPVLVLRASIDGSETFINTAFIQAIGLSPET